MNKTELLDLLGLQSSRACTSFRWPLNAATDDDEVPSQMRITEYTLISVAKYDIPRWRKPSTLIIAPSRHCKGARPTATALAMAWQYRGYV